MRNKIYNFIKLNLGIILVAIGFSFFLEPNNLVAGGVTGISLIFQHYFNIDTAIFVLIINLVLLIASLIFLGKKYFLNTIYGSIFYPLCILLFNFLVSNFNISLTNDIFLCAIFGAVFTGFGMGIVLKIDSTTGGVDILQAICYKYFHLKYSKSAYLIDGAIILAGIGIFGLDKGLYAIIHVFICGQLYDAVIFNGFNKRAVYIISDFSDSIKNIIINEFSRGVTIIPSIGGFTNTSKNMLLCIMSTSEYNKIRHRIETIDPNAFIVVTKAEEIRGFGFSIRDEENQKFFQ